jgi:hypothetical protein
VGIQPLQIKNAHPLHQFAPGCAFLPPIPNPLNKISPNPHLIFTLKTTKPLEFKEFSLYQYDSSYLSKDTDFDTI